jgi:hypothetical protein
MNSTALYQSKSRAPYVFVVTSELLAASVDKHVFSATRPTKVVAVTKNQTAVGTDGSAVTLDIKKCTSGTAPASGTSVLASTLDLKSTVNVPVNGTLSATDGNRILQAGETLALDFTGTLTAVVGEVTIVLQTF